MHLVQVIASSLLMGGVFALLACGLTIIFGVTKLVHFAYGEFVMLAMYAAYFAYLAFGISPYLSLTLVVPCFFLVGYLTQRLLLPYGSDMSAESQILITVGLSVVLQNLALVAFKPQVVAVDVAFSETITVLGVFISVPRLVASIVALLAVASLYLFLRYHRMGRAFRACAENAELASTVGIRPSRVYALAVGLGTACAALAGCLILPFYPLSPFTGITFTLTCFVIVVLGGMGDLRGALLGAIVVGVIEGMVEFYSVASMRQVGSFALFALVLLFRPRGLLGRAGGWLTL